MKPAYAGAGYPLLIFTYKRTFRDCQRLFAVRGVFLACRAAGGGAGGPFGPEKRHNPTSATAESGHRRAEEAGPSRPALASARWAQKKVTRRGPLEAPSSSRRVGDWAPLPKGTPSPQAYFDRAGCQTGGDPRKANIDQRATRQPARSPAGLRPSPGVATTPQPAHSWRLQDATRCAAKSTTPEPSWLFSDGMGRGSAIAIRECPIHRVAERSAAMSC